VQAGAAAAGHVVLELPGGDRCDQGLRRRRHTQVRFFCDRAATEAKVIAVREAEVCEYVIDVATATLCGMPSLRPLTKRFFETVCARDRMAEAKEIENRHSMLKEAFKPVKRWRRKKASINMNI
jgi:hypothetical protein